MGLYKYTDQLNQPLKYIEIWVFFTGDHGSKRDCDSHDEHSRRLAFRSCERPAEDVHSAKLSVKMEAYDEGLVD